MKLPGWLPPLNRRDEKLRAAHGLTAKRDGWYKSIDGHTRYICKPCPVPEAAAILPGRVDAIRAKSKGEDKPAARVVARGTLSIVQVADEYGEWLRQRLETGIPKKLSRRTYDDAIMVIDRFVQVCGADKPADAVGAGDFSAFARKYFANRAASSIRREIIYLEAFANWAAPGSRKAGLLVRPWQYGPDFRKPSDSEIATSAADSDKSYTPDELRTAFLRVRKSPSLRAAGWLALCCAFGPKDLGTLPESFIDLETGFVRFPRGKTGVGRLGYLPPPALLAVKRYIDRRNRDCDEAAKGLLFRTANGLPYYREPTGEAAARNHEGLGNRWHKVTGKPLSGLRSTFATVADEFTDQRAIDVVMGHLTGHSKSVRRKHYAKKFNPERVRALVSFVVPRAFGRTPPTAP